MFHQSSSRSPRSKGFRVKNIFQFSLFLIVVIWLLYQVKHSHVKKAEFASSGQTNKLSNGHGNAFLGRKGQPGYDDGINAKTDKVNYEETSERKQDGGGDDNTDRHSEEKVQDEEEIMNVGKSNEQEWQSNEQGSEESQINGGDKKNDQSEVENLKDGTEVASIKKHEESEENTSAHDENDSRKELDSNAKSQIYGGDKENDQSTNELENSNEINADSQIIGGGDTAHDFNKQHEETQGDISQHTGKESEVEHAGNEENNVDSQSGHNANDQSTSEVENTKVSTEVASNKEHEESQEGISDRGEKESEKEHEGYKESDTDSQISNGNKAYDQSTSAVENSKESSEEVFTNEHEESRDEVLDNDKSGKVEQENEENNSGSQNNGGKETTDEISGEDGGNSKKSLNDPSGQSNGMENDASIDQNEGKGVNEFHDANGVPEHDKKAENSSAAEIHSEIKETLSSDQENILTSLNQIELSKNAVQGAEESTNSTLPDQQNDIQIPTNNEALPREAVETHGNSASEAETSDKNHPENVTADAISEDELASSSLPNGQNNIPTDNGSSKAEATDNNNLEDTNSHARSDEGDLNPSLPREEYINDKQTKKEISGSEAVESQENGASEARSTGDSTPEDADVHPKSDNEIRDGLVMESSASEVVSQQLK